MLLSGNVGYTPATAVTPDGSAIVLSAGSDIAHDTGGNLVATRNATTTAEAGFSIGSGDWQNDLTGTATGDIVIRLTATAHFQIGRAHVCTTVTNAHLVCSLLLDKK